MTGTYESVSSIKPRTLPSIPSRSSSRTTSVGSFFSAPKSQTLLALLELFESGQQKLTLLPIAMSEPRREILHVFGHQGRRLEFGDDDLLVLESHQQQSSSICPTSSAHRRSILIVLVVQHLWRIPNESSNQRAHGVFDVAALARGQPRDDAGVTSRGGLRGRLRRRHLGRWGAVVHVHGLFGRGRGGGERCWCCELTAKSGEEERRRRRVGTCERREGVSSIL